MGDISRLCEKVFYINMKESKLRNIQSLENLGYLKLPIERIEAVTPSTYNNHMEYFGIDTPFDDIPKRNLEIYGKKIYRVYSKRSPRWRGDICCGLSHVKAIIEARKQGLKKVMICEDDFVYLSDEAEMFYDNIEKIPNDFDVIHITSLVHSNYKNAFRGNDLVDYKLKGLFVNDFLFQVKGGLLGTGAYIINLESKMVDEYIDILKSGGISDCLMSFRLQEKYKHYTTRYKLGYQDYQNPTTIAKTKGKDVDVESPRIKWLKSVTFNTPWSILEQRNKDNVTEVLKHYENEPIV